MGLLTSFIDFLVIEMPYVVLPWGGWSVAVEEGVVGVVEVMMERLDVLMADGKLVLLDEASFKEVLTVVAVF